jgi:hypothetical protein
MLYGLRLVAVIVAHPARLSVATASCERHAVCDYGEVQSLFTK